MSLMKTILLTLVLCLPVFAQEKTDFISEELDSLLINNEFMVIRNKAAERNLPNYIEIVNTILQLDKVHPDALHSYYSQLLRDEDDFDSLETGNKAAKQYIAFVNSFKENEINKGVKSYKLAVFFKYNFQQDKLHKLRSNMNIIKGHIERDEYDKAKDLIAASEAYAKILKSNEIYADDIEEFRILKYDFQVSERRFGINKDFEYTDSKKNLYCRISLSGFQNNAAAGRSTGHNMNPVNNAISYTYDYTYKSKTGLEITGSLFYRLYQELLVGAGYNYYYFPNGKEIDYLVHERDSKNPGYNYSFDPSSTHIKIKGNGIKLSMEYSFLADYVIHPVIGMEYYYGTVSYRGSLGLMRDTELDNAEADYDDESYSGLDAKIGVRFFYSKESDLFVELSGQLPLMKNELLLHEKKSTLGISFGYYIL